MEQYAVRDGGPVEAWSWGAFCVTNEWLTLLLAIKFPSVMNLYPRSLRFMTFTAYAVNTVDSISYRRWGPYVNWCSLTCVQPWVPTWFSPTSPDPCLLRHQILGSVLIRLPRCCLHDSPSCLHSSQGLCDQAFIVDSNPRHIALTSVLLGRRFTGLVSLGSDVSEVNGSWTLRTGLSFSKGFCLQIWKTGPLGWVCFSWYKDWICKHLFMKSCISQHHGTIF